MKKWLVVCCVIALIWGGCSLIITRPHSKQIERTLKGLQYNVGTEEITGDGAPNDAQNGTELNMLLHKSGDGLMSYHMDFNTFVSRNSSDPTVDPMSMITYNELYGGLFADSDFRTITIEVRNQEHPTLITGNADTRDNALFIADKLMKAYFKKFHLNNYIEHYESVLGNVSEMVE
ncbi:hypothetical protein [Paenibacillus sp. sgz500958]|uniref:hypothetical protein n=1 Tax=Paenibacillus sp. sgz500958 TaxID=3242475 RepID=UPI0036D261F7